MFAPALAAPFTTLLGDYDVSVGSAAGARAAITASAKATFIPRPSFLAFPRTLTATTAAK